MDELVINKYAKLCSKKVFCEKNFKNPFTLHFKIECHEAFLRHVVHSPNLIKIKKFKFRETLTKRLKVKGMNPSLEPWTKSCLGEFFDSTFYPPDAFATPFLPAHVISNDYNYYVKSRLNLDESKKIFIAKFSKENNVDEFLYYLQKFLGKHITIIEHEFELRKKEMAAAHANGFEIN
ncbi:hypothetical protein [Bacillus velezensis]|uniref:hypothetical protein n=1 Tax=Bacillus velezensis TaxID=492670 RepID=UPI0024168962|nr:hypothetical protein [Bacillus velezensis]WFP05502.1 hypothetical protein JEQ22_20030 [Bacillus velezensis]